MSQFSPVASWLFVVASSLWWRIDRTPCHRIHVSSKSVSKQMVLFTRVVAITGLHYFLNYELHISLNSNDSNKAKVDCVSFWRLSKITRVVRTPGSDLRWASRENYHDTSHKHLYFVFNFQEVSRNPLCTILFRWREQKQTSTLACLLSKFQFDVQYFASVALKKSYHDFAISLRDISIHKSLSLIHCSPAKSRKENKAMHYKRSSSMQFFLNCRQMRQRLPLEFWLTTSEMIDLLSLTRSIFCFLPFMEPVHFLTSSPSLEPS